MPAAKEINKTNDDESRKHAEEYDSDYTLTLGQIPRSPKSPSVGSADMFSTDSDLDELLSTATFDPSVPTIATKSSGTARSVHFIAPHVERKCLYSLHKFDVKVQKIN